MVANFMKIWYYVETSEIAGNSLRIQNYVEISETAKNFIMIRNYLKMSEAAGKLKMIWNDDNLESGCAQIIVVKLHRATAKYKCSTSYGAHVTLLHLF